jgi:hypothetical protein
MRNDTGEIGLSKRRLRGGVVLGEIGKWSPDGKVWHGLRRRRAVRQAIRKADSKSMEGDGDSRFTEQAVLRHFLITSQIYETEFSGKDRPL